MKVISDIDNSYFREMRNGGLFRRDLKEKGEKQLERVYIDHI